MPANLLDLIAALRDSDTVAIGAGVPGQVDFDRQVALSGGYVDLSRIRLCRPPCQTRPVCPSPSTMTPAWPCWARPAHGAARGHGNVVLFTIGTGIGGAILDHGRILRGRSAAGQLGHLTVVPGGRACVCGRRGCVETESSGTAFATHLTEAGLPPHLKAQDLLGMAPSDPRAQQVLTRWAGPLRAAIDTMITATAPDVVLIGGGAGAAALAALNTVPALKSWFDAPVLSAALQDDAGVIGAALASLPRGRRLVLVNGVPASGKSRIADALAKAGGWPVLSLDTVKAPFLAEFAPVDRPTNRRYGIAAYRAIFDVIAQSPPDATVVIDAWFGFQPRSLLEEGLLRAGAVQIVEVWCHARPDTIADRYATRANSRPAGHPGLEYVPELRALAARAAPLGGFPRVEVDTEATVDTVELKRRITALLRP